MAKSLWKPDASQVRDQEVVGRRIYEDKILKRQIDKGQVVTLRLDHFFDKRLENDLSVDRLGQSGGPNGKVTRFLEPLARNANKGSRFFGWGALRVASLRRYKGVVLAEVLATPITTSDGVFDNPYHADIVRDKFREKEQALTLAVALRDLAESDVGIVERTAVREKKGWDMFSWLEGLIGGIKGYFGK